MQTRIWLCAWIIAGMTARVGYCLPIKGEVVDNKARPVEGAEVAVYERYWIGGQNLDAKVIGPIAKSDSEGRFHLDADASSLHDAFIVARKSGLAVAWDDLIYGRNASGKGDFLLVLEPACVLTGQVVDANERPLAAAQVQAVPVTSYLSRLHQQPILAPREWLTTSTDSQGKFRFAQFGADTSMSFRVLASGRGSIQEIRAHEQNSCGFEVWRQDIRLKLATEGMVTGRVVNDRGQRVGGVSVVIHSSRTRGDVTGLYVARRTISDSNGAFAFEGIPEGPSRIEVPAPEQGPDLWVSTGADVLVKPGPVPSQATIHLNKGGAVEVTILNDETNKPIPEAGLGIYGATWKRSQLAMADANGVVTTRAPAGSYSVDVAAPQFSFHHSEEHVVSGQTLRYRVRLSPLPRPSGRLVDAAGKPAGDIAVFVVPFGSQVYTNSTGEFESRYEQQATQGGCAVARDARNGMASAVLARDWSKPIELKLGPALTLTGKVIDSNGTGIPAARVSLIMVIRNCLCSIGAEVLTDREGEFEMEAIPPAKEGFAYFISAAAANYGPKEDARIAPSGPAGSVVNLGDIQLLPADQSVSGMVLEAGGAPAAHVPIFVAGLRGVDQPAKATATNEKGEFTIRRLCKGPIRLQAGFPVSRDEAGFLMTESPAESVKIVMGKELADTGEASILGKPLPNLADLSATLSPNQVDGRPVLLCFVDIEQRPSRRCLSDLAKKTDDLAARNIGFLVIQVSKTDMKAHETWLKENSVTISVHALAGEFEARRFTWGVRSLPWLILADKTHVVRAEGFASDDLEKIIQEIK